MNIFKTAERTMYSADGEGQLKTKQIKTIINNNFNLVGILLINKPHP